MDAIDLNSDPQAGFQAWSWTYLVAKDLCGNHRTMSDWFLLLDLILTYTLASWLNLGLASSAWDWWMILTFGRTISGFVSLWSTVGQDLGQWGPRPAVWLITLSFWLPAPQRAAGHCCSLTKAFYSSCHCMTAVYYNLEQHQLFTKTAEPSWLGEQFWKIAWDVA